MSALAQLAFVAQAPVIEARNTLTLTAQARFGEEQDQQQVKEQKRTKEAK
jgi:hypothetical protein